MKLIGKKKKEEFKLPKYINILNWKFEIKRDKDIFGCFYFKDDDNNDKPTIWITPRKEDALEVFIHETLEIALELARVRYERNDSKGDYVFYYSHKEHDLVAKIMAQVFSQILENKG